MTINNRNNLVFLSYARSDASLVKDVYIKLSDAYVNVWMDTEDILPGEEWELAIDTALKRSQLVLVFISNNSVTRDGFLQKEINTAIEVWKEKAPGSIYLIPVRLEDCPIHQRLSKFHWVDIFVDSGWSKLLKQMGDLKQESLNNISSQSEIDTDNLVQQDNSNFMSQTGLPLVTFPDEVKRFLLDCLPEGHWEHLDEETQRFILTLGCKLEPIVQIVPPTPTPLVIGFECLGLGALGENFVEICERCIDIDPGLLRLCLAISSIRTISTLRVEATKKGILGARNLLFSLNLDPFMMDSDYLRKFLNWYYHDLEHNVLFEVNETTTKQYLRRLKNLQVDFKLRFAADDLNNWHKDVRDALINRVEMTKMDNYGFVDAMELRGDDKKEALRLIQCHNIPSKPLIVEGIEDPDYLHFLERNWDYEKYGQLYGQGYAIEAGLHWDSTVQPLKGYELPGGSILLQPPTMEQGVRNKG